MRDERVRELGGDGRVRGREGERVRWEGERMRE